MNYSSKMTTSTNTLKSILFCCTSLSRSMKYFDRQAVTILLVTVVVCLQLSLPNHTVNAAAAAQPRIRNNRNPGCDEDQQNKMNKEYQECQQKFTNLHHTNIGTAITTEDHQVSYRNHFFSILMYFVMIPYNLIICIIEISPLCLSNQ